MHISEYLSKVDEVANTNIDTAIGMVLGLGLLTEGQFEEDVLGMLAMLSIEREASLVAVTKKFLNPTDETLAQVMKKVSAHLNGTNKSEEGPGNATTH